MWMAIGSWGGIFLAYGIGKSIYPDAPLLIVCAIIFGASALGATLGKIANG